jgi:hypothetical protein
VSNHTNNQQPTTNNQQPTTNNQQPTTNNQQPTTNNQPNLRGRTQSKTQKDCRHKLLLAQQEIELTDADFSKQCSVHKSRNFE